MPSQVPYQVPSNDRPSYQLKLGLTLPTALMHVCYTHKQATDTHMDETAFWLQDMLLQSRDALPQAPVLEFVCAVT